MTPVTSANAEMSASSASAPASGWPNMTTPNAIETSPASASSNDRPPARRTNARVVWKMPTAIAHAAIA